MYLVCLNDRDKVQQERNFGAGTQELKLNIGVQDF
jgi:hypothetical protein